MPRTGTVKRQFDEKGYGFIDPGDGARDLFFHAKDCDGGVLPGLDELVSYTLVPEPRDPRKMRAACVSILAKDTLDQQTHRGVWRDLSMTGNLFKRCSLPNDAEGMLCMHGGGIIGISHWSCCGNTNSDSTRCLNQQHGMQINPESSAGLSSFSDSGASLGDAAEVHGVMGSGGPPDGRVEMLSCAREQAPTQPVAVRDKYDVCDRNEYYRTMAHNVKVEFVYECGKAKGNKPMVLRQVFTSTISPGRLSMGNAWVGTPSAADAAACASLKDNIVSCDGELYWVTKAEVVQAEGKEALVYLQGFGPGDKQLCDASADVAVLCFAGSSSAQWAASMTMLEAGAQGALEASVLNSMVKLPGTYEAAPLHPTTLFPMNESQRAAVLGARNRVEVIHGPPGTGKSTTIVSYVQQRVPQGTAVVITAVCNQAVDSVASKLAQVRDAAGGTPFLVLGNPDRVGETAAKFTMARLAEREGHAVFMAKIVTLLEKAEAGLVGLQDKRAERFMHLAARYVRYAVTNAFRKLRRSPGGDIMELSVPDGTNVTVVSESGGYSLIRFEVPGGARAKHGWIRSSGLNMREKRVSKFARAAAAGTMPYLLHVRRALAVARKTLAFAENTAEERVVQQTRAFLCTISSSYRVTQLFEKYPKARLRLFAAILDEAGATPEPYVPQLMQLGVENLVMLGDHCQLPPLVLGKDKDELTRKKVNRSLMKRFLDCDPGCARMLSTQYRMFRELGDLVSSMFYDGKLLSDTKSGGILRWIDVPGHEQRVGTSYVNAEQTAAVVGLFTGGCPVLSATQELVKVIVMYKWMVELVKKVLAVFAPGRNIDVGTVDACQGTEAPHVVLVTVRSNREGAIGFVQDPHRMCVALSRAQKSLTIVGDQDQLRRDAKWSQAAAHCMHLIARPSSDVASLALDAAVKMQARNPPRGGHGGGKGGTPAPLHGGLVGGGKGGMPPPLHGGGKGGDGKGGGGKGGGRRAHRRARGQARSPARSATVAAWPQDASSHCDGCSVDADAMEHSGW